MQFPSDSSVPYSTYLGKVMPGLNSKEAVFHITTPKTLHAIQVLGDKTHHTSSGAGFGYPFFQVG